MSKKTQHVLLLEPYYGGSHKSFLRGLQLHLDFSFTLISLPARKWKMRMQLAAPWFAEQILELMSKGAVFDCLLSSTFMDLAVLRSQLARRGVHLPMAVYFHENQFVYPFGKNDQGQFQFSAINFTTALSADRLAFNSQFNMDTFISGVTRYLKKAADMDLGHLGQEIRDKLQVLYPGMDYSELDDGEEGLQKNKRPVIVWNHRWEHDKDPESFFTTLFTLSDQGLDFDLIVLGENFNHKPPIFAKAQEVLDAHIIHFGYAEDRKEYLALLKQGDIVVSTAIHEFFGMAVMEAVRAGCTPLVPDRLSYKELIPDVYRYQQDALSARLAQLLDTKTFITPAEQVKLTQPYAWESVSGKYEAWIEDLIDFQKRLTSG